MQFKVIGEPVDLSSMELGSEIETDPVFPGLPDKDPMTFTCTAVIEEESGGKSYRFTAASWGVFLFAVRAHATNGIADKWELDDSV